MTTDDSNAIHWYDIRTLADRSTDIRALCGRLMRVWGYNLEKRRPGIAHVDADGHPVTDMDLAVFLSGLVENRIVCSFPEFKSMRVAQKRESEWITSKENRHGRLTGLFSNAAVASMGVRMDDLNVMQVESNGETTVGAARNFTMQSIDGTWHEGWGKGMKILATGIPKEVFEELTEASRTLKFKYFVHPSRWPSLYGKYYVIAKAAIMRLQDEIRDTKKYIKELRDHLEIPPKVWAKSAKVGKGEKTKVWAYEVKLEGFELEGEYIFLELEKATEAHYKAMVAYQKRLSEFLDQLRFLTRATEYAFRMHAVQTNIPDKDALAWLKGDLGADVQPRRPVWIRNEEKLWSLGHVEPGKRNNWARMEMKEGISLLFRMWQKSEWVAA